MKKFVWTLLCPLFILVLFAGQPAFGGVGTEVMADYTDVPISLSNSVTPNILVILDNSMSMNDFAYTTAYDPAQSYYGYFSNTPGCNYTYSSNKFNLDNAGVWSGNFLNWATMEKTDVLRKVLVGGHATSRVGGGNTTLQGNTTSPMNPTWKIGPTVATAGDPYTPPADKYNYFELSSGNLNVYQYGNNTHSGSPSSTLASSLSVVVTKSSTFTNASGALCDGPSMWDSGGNIAGLMQQIGTKARWGLEFFNPSYGVTTEGCHGGGCNDGGYIAQAINGPGYGTNFLPGVENQAANAYTPLAESLFTAAGYFSQNKYLSNCVTGGNLCLQYQSQDYNVGAGTFKDPLFFGGTGEPNSFVPCAKNFVIIITDGAPTYDSNIPAGLKNYATTAFTAAGKTYANYNGTAYTAVVPGAGNMYQSSFLDNVALWAHTTSLRPDLTPSTVTLTIYPVLVFGEPTAMTFLRNTARNGGFIDSNGNNIPDLQSEWASLGRQYSGVTIPDTYYEATDGATLETELMAAINDILKRASSGTAVSVLATSATGAGYVYQAFFLPTKTIIETAGARTITWLGDLMQLNVDSTGSLRDKNNNCINFTFDTPTNQTVINNLSQTAGVCGTSVTSSTPLISYANYNWNAAYTLLAKDPDASPARNIITFVDTNQNGVVDAGEQISFNTTSAAALTPYLNVVAPNTAANIINWIRGNSVTNYRDRTLSSTATYASGLTQQYKLGDVIHSTPTVLGAPLENYGLIYQDGGYSTWYKTTGIWDRQDMVYVGSNDGMLHAFDNSGNEVWAFIPYNLLPHLRWLMDPNYTHVDYVDMKMKATDVNMGTTASPNWKTILLGGMRFGGGQITNACCVSAPSVRNFVSAYFAIDITVPTAPVVLWETNYTTPLPSGGTLGTTLGYSMTYPCIVKAGDNFFAVVGSGTNSAYIPDYSGGVTQTGKVIVINIKTGAIAATFSAPETKSYFTDPIAVDITLFSQKSLVGAAGQSYGADAVYIGETYQVGSNWFSRMWRLVTNNDVNPLNWKFGKLYDDSSGQPITGAAAASSDTLGNLWIYFGTGKYYSTTDKTDTGVQSFYGVKDPCWQAGSSSYNASCLTSSVAMAATSLCPNATYCPGISSQLVDTTGTMVYTTGVVSGGGANQTASTFTNLTALVSTYSGWHFNLTSSPSPAPSERSLNKPTVFGGLVMFTSFIPTSDPCGMGGNSYVYAVYYLTGTAYPTPTIGTGAANLVLSRSATSSVGQASSITIHSGREAGATAYIQMSTGQTITVSATPPTTIKSGIISWREL